MQRILSRRVWRELKANFFRYLALFALIVMGMYIIVAMVGGAEMVIQNVERGHEENCLEDGQFSVFVPLNEAEITRIEEKGVTLEKAFFMDYSVGESTVRIFANREKMNLFSLSKGRLLEKENEILLEQHYAAANGLDIGSVITVGGREFRVAGLGSTPDYDAVYANMSDSSVDSEQFGTGFVLQSDYEQMRREGKSFKAEEYCYSYHLNDCMTNEELKELLQSFELDRSQVTDTYFLEMLDEIEETKTDIKEGIEELLDGSEELSDGLFEIAENNEDLRDAADSLFEAMLEEANKGFEDAGIKVVLTEGEFEAQIDKMLANPGAYSEKTKQDLRDTKESLQGIRDFKDGITEYTDGVHEASRGSADLCVGLTEITKNNKTLNNSMEALYNAILLQYQQGLATQEQLVAVGTLKEAVKAYTAGVSEASTGSQHLTHGMSVLYTAGDPIKEGTDELFDGMIEMVNEQLSESEIEANITAENFESELNRLTGANSPVDAKLRESLADTKEMLLDLKDFKEGIEEYTDAVQEAADGSLELVDGVKELQEEADEMLDEYFTFDIDNLTAFVAQEDNPRVGASIDDVMINKLAGMVAGVIIMILFTYVISVFVVHSIEQESSVIGALYALGVKRKQLLLHYLVLPVVITFLGGIVGCMVGFSPMGVESQAQEAVAYFSLPVMKSVYPLYLIVYGLVMPPLAAVVVNVLVISKKLKRTALSLMRGEEKAKKIKEMNLGKMSFIRRFQIRQILREMRSAAAVVGGMFICLLVLMIGVNCYVLCENFRAATVRDTTYEYMYFYKYPTEEVPVGGTEGYVESLKKEDFGYQMEVAILGLTEDNSYFDVQVSGKQNEIVISSAVATKFGVAVGEKLVLTDDVNDRDYAFTIVDVYPHNSSLYAFMDIEAMRELFEQEDDYYNVVFADEALDIESGRLYATTSREKVAEASEIFVEMMWPMIIMMSSMSAIIFMVVMYLMMKVMIDRAAFPIALMKVFGYRKGEIKKLYLDGNFLVVAVGALICLPLSKLVMDGIYPYFVSNVAIGMDLAFSWQLYVGIYAAIIVLYLVINWLLVGRLKKVNLAEVLKNRE